MNLPTTTPTSLSSTSHGNVITLMSLTYGNGPVANRRQLLCPLLTYWIFSLLCMRQSIQIPLAKDGSMVCIHILS